MTELNFKGECNFSCIAVSVPVNLPPENSNIDIPMRNKRATLISLIVGASKARVREFASYLTTQAMQSETNSAPWWRFSSQQHARVVLQATEEVFKPDSQPISRGIDPMWNSAKIMMCGGVSGAVAKTCTAPLARLTILYQVQ